MAAANRYEEALLPDARAMHPSSTTYGIDAASSAADQRIGAAAAPAAAAPLQNNIGGQLATAANDLNTGGGGSSSVKNLGTVQQMQSKVPTKRPIRRGIKQPPDRPPRALFLFNLKNPLRKICISVVEWKYPFFF